MSVHIKAPSNEHLHLCQEFSMRTEGFDGLARVEGPDGWTTFAAMVAAEGLEGAIRSVRTCHWLSSTDAGPDWRLKAAVECDDCKEVFRA